MKHGKVCALSIVLLLMVVSSPSGQTGYIEERTLYAPRFGFDFAAFRSDTSRDMVSLEVYYQIYNDGLQYFKRDGKFVAEYEISVVILGGDKNQVAGFSRERKYIVDSYRETQNSEDFLVNQFEVEVPKGKFKVICNVIDKLSSKSTFIEKDLEVKGTFRNKVDMSDIQFVRAVEDIGDEPSAFDKGEKRVIPSVMRTFSAEDEKASFYVELYNDNPQPQDVSIKYTVKGRRSKPVYKDEFSLKLDRSVTRLIKEIPAEKLVPDEYEITFELNEKKPGKKTRAERRTEFEIEWSLGALVKNDYETAVEQLRYIASRKEMDALKKLKNADPEQREKSFEDFWKAHDKYPETAENETRTKYYDRVKHANRYFSVVNQPGWRTDQGRIYIIFGEPDNVERYPFELDNVPYQLWHYYRYSPPRTFRFEDTHLTGDYNLTYPYDGWRGGLHESFEDFN